MSLQYQAVGWNRQKRIYDVTLVCVVLAYLTLFAGVGAAVFPSATIETLLIRAFGTAAFLLLHVILCIGPLCRLDARFLPLLYNRRHLGVTMFLLALTHGVFSLIQFHALGDVSPFISLFVSNTRYSSLPDFPFQPFGFAALLILFLMAATSHDFWLRNLSAPTWKRLHMAVYGAYGLIIGHVVFGALQSETSAVFVAVAAIGLCTVTALHVAAGLKENAPGEVCAATEADGFVEVCAVDRIPENRAVIVSLAGERVAVFRYDGKIAALSNVCQHQNGPLGEGRIIDGCVTCPWHGYQYLPDSGASPAPFTEKVPTFRTRIDGNKVLVHPCPMKPGMRTEPTRIGAQMGARQ